MVGDVQYGLKPGCAWLHPPVRGLPQMTCCGLIRRLLAKSKNQNRRFRQVWSFTQSGWLMKEKCPFCTGESSRLRFTAPLDCITFKPTGFGAVYECDKCLAGFIFPRPTPAETGTFYELDSYYTQGKSHLPDTKPPGFFTKARVHLAWRADEGQSLADVISTKLKPGSSIVDIGCGGGNLLRDLASRGYRMTGVERDANSVALKSAEVSILEGSAEALPAALTPHSYDGVVFSHVLEHLVDPVAAIRLAASLLKPGGLLFGEVPNNESSIAKQSGVAWGHLDAPRHINFFCQRSFHDLMKAAGLEVKDTYFNGYNRYFHDSHIANEQKIYDEFLKSGWQPERSIRNSVARSWALLGKTAFARPRNKYDAIGVVATQA